MVNRFRRNTEKQLSMRNAPELLYFEFAPTNNGGLR
jgi:hypothetical protein